MKKIELKPNQIVKLANGLYGAVASFNDKPFQIIFNSYTDKVENYDERLTKKNQNYNIDAIYDGNGLENVREVFKKSFNPENFNLPKVWQR